MTVWTQKSDVVSIVIQMISINVIDFNGKTFSHPRRISTNFTLKTQFINQSLTPIIVPIKFFPQAQFNWFETI